MVCYGIFFIDGLGYENWTHMAMSAVAQKPHDAVEKIRYVLSKFTEASHGSLCDCAASCLNLSLKPVVFFYSLH